MKYKFFFAPSTVRRLCEGWEVHWSIVFTLPHCDVIWSVFQLAELEWVVPLCVLLLCIDFGGFGLNNKKALSSCGVCVVICIVWLERNARVFEDKYKDWGGIFGIQIVIALLFWALVSSPFKGMLLFFISRFGELFVDGSVFCNFSLLVQWTACPPSFYW